MAKGASLRRPSMDEPTDESTTVATGLSAMQWLSLLIFATIAYSLHNDNSGVHTALQQMGSMAIVSVGSLTKTIEESFGASEAPAPPDLSQTFETLIQEAVVYVQNAFQGDGAA